MRVHIGRYRRRLTFPLRVHDWYFTKRFGDYDHDEKDYNFFDRVVIKTTDAMQDLVNKYVNVPWLDERERNIKVRVDDYDVWNADHTLALIIHPVLLKLKGVKHGSPFVDNEDVPEHLRSPKAKYEQDDDSIHARWGWVLDEMIWAFEQCTDPSYNDDQFYSGEIEWSFIKDEKSGLSQIVKGPGNTLKVDEKGQGEHYDRIKNGHRLFGKYYLSLWD